jgi:hypothetical protein
VHTIRPYDFAENKVTGELKGIFSRAWHAGFGTSEYKSILK